MPWRSIRTGDFSRVLRQAAYAANIPDVSAIRRSLAAGVMPTPSGAASLARIWYGSVGGAASRSTAPYQIRARPEGSQSEVNHAQFVADACVRKLAHRAHATGGLILLDREGLPAAAHNTPQMAYGFVKRDGTFQVVP